MVASVDAPSRMVVIPGEPDRMLTARGVGFTTRWGNGYWAAGSARIRSADSAPGPNHEALLIRSMDLDRFSFPVLTMRSAAHMVSVNAPSQQRSVAEPTADNAGESCSVATQAHPHYADAHAATTNW